MDSVIKLDKIATVLKDLVIGEIGEIDETIKKEVTRKFKKLVDKLWLYSMKPDRLERSE